jgi:hypothetical protein
MQVRTIECPDRLILSCLCGERVVLIGRPVDWYEEDRLAFSCECGKTLTLSDCLPEDWTLFKSYQKEQAQSFENRSSQPASTL